MKIPLGAFFYSPTRHKNRSTLTTPCTTSHSNYYGTPLSRHSFDRCHPGFCWFSGAVRHVIVRNRSSWCGYNSRCRRPSRLFVIALYGSTCFLSWYLWCNRLLYFQGLWRLSCSLLVLLIPGWLATHIAMLGRMLDVLTDFQTSSTIPFCV